MLNSIFIQLQQIEREIYADDEIVNIDGTNIKFDRHSFTTIAHRGERTITAAYTGSSLSTTTLL